MSHTPGPYPKSNQPRSNPPQDDSATDLAARMGTMSIGATPQHPPAPGIEPEIYGGTGGLRHHLSGSSHSHPYSQMGHLNAGLPQAPFGYHEYGTPYWAAQTPSGGGGGGGGSAPPSAGAMGVFNVPFTPTDPSSPTATFPYDGSTLDNNRPAAGYEASAYHQHQQQTLADIYATGQGAFGLTQPPPPRRRGGAGGGYGGQAEYDDRGWSPPQNGHTTLDGAMTTLGAGAGGGGRLTDPATAPYYGLGGPGYVMPQQGVYGNQGGDRRKQHQGNGSRNGARSYRQQNEYQTSTAPMSPISASSHYTGYQAAPQGLPIQYGLHPNYVPSFWRGGNNSSYSRREHIPRSALLDDFRMNKSRKWSLEDIAGHVVEFCGDQHGSRFIQQRIEQGSDEIRAAVLSEIDADCFALMTDVFGNYVLQKLFEVCNQGEKAQLAAKMEGNVFKLSLETYGCRVVQKAFEHVLQDQKDRLVEELRGKVVECVKDNNGNHVIQRLLTLPNCPEFIHKAFVGHVKELACHPFGCRVFQKTFECLDPAATRDLLEEMHEDILRFTEDSFANYVVQSIISSTTPEDRHRVIKSYKGNLQNMARHKSASNVIEKALKEADEQDRREMIDELIGEQKDGSNQVYKLLKDAYGNFPVQTALGVADRDQRDKLLESITACLPQLKHTPVGKRLEMRLSERGLSLTPPPLNPLSASTSAASDAPSGPETVLSEETGADLVQVRSRSGIISGGGGQGKEGSKQSFSSLAGGARDEEVLENLLH